MPSNNAHAIKTNVQNAMRPNTILGSRNIARTTTSETWMSGKQSSRKICPGEGITGQPLPWGFGGVGGGGGRTCTYTVAVLTLSLVTVEASVRQRGWASS